MCPLYKSVANTTNMIMGQTLKLRRKLLVGVRLKEEINWSDPEGYCCVSKINALPNSLRTATGRA